MYAYLNFILNLKTNKCIINNETMNGKFQLMHNHLYKGIFEISIHISFVKNMTYAYPLDWSKIP